MATPLKHILLNYSPITARTLKPDAIPSQHIENIDRTVTSINIDDIARPNSNNPGNTKPLPVQGINDKYKHSKPCSDAGVTNGNNDSDEKNEGSNTLPANEIAGTSQYIEISHEINDGSNKVANQIAGDLKVHKKSDGNIIIPLAEYKQLQKTANKFNVLKNNLDNIFTPGQVRCLMMSKKRRIKWSAEDISAAVSLSKRSPKCYHYLRNNVGIPLPALSTLRHWNSRFEKKEGLSNNNKQIIILIQE